MLIIWPPWYINQYMPECPEYPEYRRSFGLLLTLLMTPASSPWLSLLAFSQVTDKFLNCCNCVQMSPWQDSILLVWTYPPPEAVFNSHRSDYETMDHGPRTSYNSSDRSFVACALKLWNEVPEDTTDWSAIVTCQMSLKPDLFKKTWHLSEIFLKCFSWAGALAHYLRFGAC